MMLEKTKTSDKETLEQIVSKSDLIYDFPLTEEELASEAPISNTELRSKLNTLKESSYLEESEKGYIPTEKLVDYLKKKEAPQKTIDYVIERRELASKGLARIEYDGYLSKEMRKKFDIPDRLEEDYRAPGYVPLSDEEEKLENIKGRPEGKALFIRLVTDAPNTKEEIFHDLCSIKGTVEVLREELDSTWDKEDIQSFINNKTTSPRPKSKIEWDIEMLKELSYIKETEKGLGPTEKLLDYFQKRDSLNQKLLDYLKGEGIVDEDYKLH